MSDSHLGFQDLNKVDEKGRNIIEEMVYSGFSKTIDKIIELKPDAVVHAEMYFTGNGQGSGHCMNLKKEWNGLSMQEFLSLL